MQSILLDTSAYSWLLRGQIDVVKVVKSASVIYISYFTIAELRDGFRYGTKELENTQKLDRFLKTEIVHTLYPDDSAIEFFVVLSNYCRKNGKSLAHHDKWIATQAQQYKTTLISFDRDFSGLASNILVQILESKKDYR